MSSNYEQPPKWVESFTKLANLCQQADPVKNTWHQSLKYLKELFHCSVAVIGLLSDENSQFTYLISTTTEQELISLYGPADEGIFGWVYSRETPYLANTLYAEPAYLRVVEQAVGFALKSMIAVPIIFNSKVVAIVGVFNSTCDSFSGRELGLLGNFAGMLEPVLSHRFFAEKLSLELDKLKKGYEFSLSEERLSAMALMAAGVAHEIQSPMAAISGYMQLLKRQIKDQKVLTKISRIEGSVSAVNLITNGLSSFSRKASPSWEILDINSIIDSAVVRSLVSFSRSPIVIVEKNYCNDLPMVEAYGDELRQVFINILDNAAQAIIDEGQVFISTSLEEEGSVEYNESVRRIKIVIADSGSGIPERYREKVFVPFFSGGKLSGAGLGLSLCRSVMKRHRGEINFRCPDSGGTEFTVYIPVVTSEIK